MAALSTATATYHLLCRRNTDNYWWEQHEDREGRRRSVNLKTLAVERDGGARALRTSATCLSGSRQGGGWRGGCTGAGVGALCAG